MGNQFKKLSRHGCISSTYTHDLENRNLSKHQHSPPPSTHDDKDLSTVRVVPSKSSMLSDNTLQDKDVSPPSKDTISSAWTVLSEGSVLSDNTCKDTDVSPAWVGPSKRNIPSTRSQEDTRLVSSKPPIPSVDALEDKDLLRKWAVPSRRALASANMHDQGPSITGMVRPKRSISSANLYEDEDVSRSRVFPTRLDPHDINELETNNQGMLRPIRSHVCKETGERHVFWNHVQFDHKGVDHLVDGMGCRVLFEVKPNGELYRPLRIKQGNEYQVVLKSRSYQPLLQHSIHQSTTLSTLRSNTGRSRTADLSLRELEQLLDQLLDEGEGKSPVEQRLPFDQLLETCFRLYRQVKRNIRQDKDSFRQLAVSARHHHGLLMEEIQRMDATRIKVQLKGNSRTQILGELREHGQQDLDWDYLNTCHNTFINESILNESPAPRLFIVLPADLDTWDDMDQSTHSLRLYFLCDIKNKNGPQRDLPNHIHLSDHGGYTLERPLDFIHEYGDYQLRMLEAVKRGYDDDNLTIPRLGTFKILWDHNSMKVGSKISKDTLRPLIDKTIAYLQMLSPPKWPLSLELSRSQCAILKTFFSKVQNGDNLEGNLHRCIDPSQHVYWRCQKHAQQGLRQDALARLGNYVCSHGGHVDMQQSALRVNLTSGDEAEHFTTLLSRTKHIFNISIKLFWKPMRSDLEKLCVKIAKAESVSLEIDGVALDTHSLEHVEYMTSVFATSIVPKTSLQMIALLNFPLPRQRLIFTSGCSFQFSLSTPQEFSWMELRSELSKFRVLYSVAREVSNCTAASEELRLALAKHGFEGVTAITLHQEHWDATCDLEKGKAVGMNLFAADYDTSLVYVGGLQKLTVHTTDPEFGSEFDRVVQANAGIDDLNVLIAGGDEIGHVAEYITRIWEITTEFLQLTLFERAAGEQSRTFAQVGFDGKGCNWIDLTKDDPSSKDCQGCQALSQHQTQGIPSKTKFVQWECDYSSQLRSENAASVLNLACRQHPWVLTSFVLDILCLSPASLACVQNILRQSYLDHLTVVCTPVDPALSEFIAETLLAVQWPTIKSLLLFGDHIDEWIQLWATSSETQVALSDPTTGPNLLRVHLQAAGSAPQLLSHASVLFIHRLIQSSPLAEMYFQRVLLQDKRNWGLIVESVEPLLLEALGLCRESTEQLMDAGEAWELFQAKFEVAE